ncbi:MAG TPA: PilZ domain-containing protein [Terriglobales bacterium]|nr:PilZ domain-containing protein [Terriglobales bacterium]
MSDSISVENERRAPRVKLAGVVLALVQLENGRQIHGRLHQLSFTGGLLHLDDPLDEGINVEVMFHVSSCTVRSKAVVLFPMWATQGCHQPVRFLDLTEADRSALAKELDALVRAGAPEVEEDL